MAKELAAYIIDAPGSIKGFLPILQNGFFLAFN